MKVAVALSNILLAGIGLWGGFSYLPRVYHQAHFQFSDPRGGLSMWPGTVNSALFVASFFACLVAVSWVFNRPLSVPYRIAALIISALLLAGWCVNAYLSSEYMPEYFGPIRPSFVSSMIGFGGLPYIVTAIVALIISGASGRGPVSHIAQRFSRK
jgi:CHASE2 domain-containing sensor protein